MTKKYTLKPGKHQFAPGSPAVHEDSGLSDEEAEWYLQRYPHIAGLFIKTLKKCKVEARETDEPETTGNVTRECLPGKGDNH